MAGSAVAPEAIHVRTGRRVSVGFALFAFACISAAAPNLSRSPAPDDGRRAIVGLMLGEVAPSARAVLDTSVLHRTRVSVHSVTSHHPHATVSGEATYYADRFDGRRTASGIRFRQTEMFAAHRTFPFGTVLRVTNERNGRSVVVRVVDRGPWGSVAKRRNTIIDVSRAAAEQLGFVRAGRTPVRLEVLLLGNGV